MHLRQIESGDRRTDRTRPGGQQQLVITATAAIGKRHGFAENLRDWFKALYEILLGQSAGPRFGSFVAFYGPAETKALIDQVLSGEELGKPAA